MKLIKVMMLGALMAVSTAAFAINDEDSLKYSSALIDGDVALVKQFLNDGIVNVDERRAFFGWSALQTAAVNGHLDVVKVLVEHKANLNFQHELTKNTALHLAALNGFKDVVQYLVDAGADVNLKMRGDVALLRVVRDSGNTAMVDLLVKAGAKDDGCQEEKCF